MGRAWRWLGQWFAVLVVVGAFVWSAAVIWHTRRKEKPPGTEIVLRIGHWQLEAGVRQALNEMAAEYHRLHPNVTVVQEPIPEATYGTWLTTQLMGGTAPDLLEPGVVMPGILVGYYSRYFVSLTPYVDQPNPYNAGTPLAGQPWRRTFRDGMRKSYIDELQEYMTVPLAQFGVRVFYNKDLFKKLTGLDEPPRELRAFLAVCAHIKRQRNPEGQFYIPIAGSAYHYNSMWDPYLLHPLTYRALRELDLNRDAGAGMDEFYVAWRTGRIGFDHPAFAARFRMAQLLTEQFQTGWTGLGRDEAVFLFAQSRAVFITTGTWDAGSLREQAAGDFTVGVMDFPRPTKDDPEFGALVEGPVYERPEGGFPFSITRTCPHPEVALDFLQFLSSQRGNERLNQLIGWIPSVEGATVPAELRAFEPNLEGVFGAMPVTISGDTGIKWQQLSALFNIGQIDYPNLASNYAAYYAGHAPEEFAEFGRNKHRSVPKDERFLSAIRSRALLATGDEATQWWVKYRTLTGNRRVFRNLSALYLDSLLATGPVTNALAPYAFRPEALANVRARLAGEQGGH